MVHARSEENLGRLLAALDELEARYRDPAGRDLRPGITALAGNGHHLLLTRCGPVDVLAQIGSGRRYEDLLADSVEMRVGNVPLRVLGLAALIRSKEESGREKDLAVLGVLRRTLRESGKD